MLVTRAIVWQQCGVVLTAWAVQALYRSERSTGQAKKFGPIRRVSSQLPIRFGKRNSPVDIAARIQEGESVRSEDAPVKLKG